MVLSIGMIVKNEEKYLGQCLTALRPILENVDSELIIADTGSSDSTVEIAKGFTDNVYHFEWIDDFSAARNSTLEKAKGEWYMFIDADEIIRDCAGIVDFFKSGEYRKYNSATYVQRSYSNIVGGEVDHGGYSDFRVLRLTKKLKEIAFRNPIHEALSPFFTPTKHLPVIAEHFGYLFYIDGKISEAAIEKSKRYLNLLLKITDEAENEIDQSVYKEISDCYIMLGEEEKALEYLKKGLNALNKSSMVITAYFSKTAALLFHMQKFKDVIALCGSYFDKTNTARRTPLATDTEMYFYKGIANYNEKRYTDAISDLCSFFDLYDKYINNKLNTDDLIYNSISFTSDKLCDALNVFYDSCIKEKKYDTAAKYKAPFPIDAVFGANMYEAEKQTILFAALKSEIMKNIGYGELADLYTRLNVLGQNQLVSAIRWDLFTSDREIRENAIENLKAVGKTDSRIAKAAEICGNYFFSDSVDADYTENYLNEYGSSFNADILYMMLDKNIDITAFVNAEDFLANECVHAVFSANEDFLRLLEKYNIGAVSEKGLEKTAELYKYAIALAASRKLNISGLMKKYGAVGIKWRECFEDSGAPREIKSAEAVSRITSAFDQKDYRLCTNEMNGFLAAFPEFSPIIALYRSIVDQAEKEAQAAAPKALSEFEQMALAVKRNIRGMIRVGSAEDAENALNEYEALCPGDIEIKILREEISGLK